MRTTQFALLFALSFSGLTGIKSQNLQKTFLEQGFEYYFATRQYDQALKTLETLQRQFDLRSVKLDFALNLAVKYKRDDLIVPLLEECYHDFNSSLSDTEASVGEFQGDTSFRFAAYFGKKWPKISHALVLKTQQFEDNLKGDYYSTLQNFLSVDQFVRFNEVSSSTFNQVDSINMDNFTLWLLEYPREGHLKSRLNNQMLMVLLRHLGPKRFAMLNDKKIFSDLLETEIISPQDFGLLYDYLHPKPLYFVEYDAFVEKSWDKSGIKTLTEIQALDQRRRVIGLLPLEYSGFCLQKGIVVPAELKYAKPVEGLIFGGK